MRNILITGGAGFVGSNLACLWKHDFPEDQITALDNLKRRGSELSLPRLKECGIRFLHGDIRNPEDLESLGDVDLILECSAEPSVQAGYEGSSRYLINTNLFGTLNCLEFARERDAQFLFLSTSRVYPIPLLQSLPLEKNEDRFYLPSESKGTGWSARGISEDFPLEGMRSLYGATKLSSELFVQEYAASFGMKVIINRCGVLTGPWQMGKVDQGFVSLWASRFLYGGQLSYTGFEGHGRQVRDILHISDLYELLKIQVQDISRYSGKVFNVGGGASNSLSLRELSRLCSSFTKASLNITSAPITHPTDIPYYISDNRLVTSETGWSPQKSIEATLEEIFRWLQDYKPQLEALFKAPS
jgi:CDP-paratose 2-epimerase